MQYPHEFSGGMKQRAVIALALICSPKILIADEPTTALDVVAQRQVIELLAGLQDEFNISIVMISHDISAVARPVIILPLCTAEKLWNRERARMALITNNHPYTHALVGSFRRCISLLSTLAQIPGSAPNLAGYAEGCPFCSALRLRNGSVREENPRTVTYGWTNSASVILQRSWISTKEEPCMSNMVLDKLSKQYVLKAGFFTQLSGKAGIVSAVDQVSFVMEEGEIVGLVGESGCGKTTLGKMLLK